MTAYPVAYRYEQNKDVAGFMAYLLPIALAFNSKISTPLKESEVNATVKSIVMWCIYRYEGFSKESAKKLADLRWRDHVKKTKEVVVRSCTTCGTDITGKNKQAKFCCSMEKGDRNTPWQGDRQNAKAAQRLPIKLIQR